MPRSFNQELQNTQSVRDSLKFIAGIDGGKSIGDSIRSGGGAHGIGAVTESFNHFGGGAHAYGNAPVPIASMPGDGGMSTGASGFPMLENPHLAETMSDPNAPWLSNKPYSRHTKVSAGFMEADSMTRAEQMYAGMKQWVRQRDINPKKIIPEDIREYLKLWDLKADGVQAIIESAGMKEGQVVLSQQLTDVITEVADAFESLAVPRDMGDGALGASSLDADPVSRLVESFKLLTGGDQKRAVSEISKYFKTKSK